MGAFEELLESWRSNPSADSTIGLCSYLSATPSEDVVREVGSRAEQWHAQDGDVMLAVGRMYLEAGLLAEAQTSLVSAGKANPKDGRAFRYLGEVLLRRGDAARADKVLQRAMQLGLSDAETKLWHDRSVVYVALQKRVGPQAVAAEVARTLPKRANSMAPAQAPAVKTSPWAEDQPTMRKAPAAQAPPAARPMIINAPGRLGAPPPLPESSRPPPPPSAPPVHHLDDDDETVVKSPPSSRGRAPFITSNTGTLTRPYDRPPPSVRPLPPPSTPPPPPPASRAASQPMPQYYAPPPSARGVPSAPYERPYAAQAAALPPVSGQTAPYAGGYTARMPAPIPRAPLEDDESTNIERYDVANPTPEVVLESLARVGLYEPGGGAPPAWEKAQRVRTRGSWVLSLATLLVLIAGTGGYFYARKVKIERAETARRLTDEVEVMLHSGEVAQLRASDDRLARVFDLDSRSQRAAKLWLQNRVLGALILPSESRGIDAAVHRARSVDIPESEVAFGKIASFLAEGDLAGAAAVLPRYDREAGKDAYYQLAAGAVLERAGDIRAVERYEAARALDPKLVITDIMLARVVLLELGPAKAKPVIDELRKKTGDTATTRALEALMWAVDPDRPKELPKSAVLSEEDKKILIGPLEPIPAIVEALQDIGGGLEKKAIGSIDSAISLSDSPAMAAQLGFLAIKAGDEKLARKAALRALQFSALYSQARVLASRVALLGGRLDEAKKAIEELDPQAPEVAVVRAVLSYETLDTSELGSSIEALGEFGKKHPDYAALNAAPAVLRGSDLPSPDKLPGMAQPWVVWGELIAVDAALDMGELDLADKMIKNWGEGASRPVYALRVARLARYRNDVEQADKQSSIALEQGTTTVSVLVERIFALVDKNEANRARDLISKYPSLLGPMAQWLRMYVDGKSNRAADARVKAAQLDLPPDQSPLLLRVVAARALASIKDRRAKSDLFMLQRNKLSKHPDLVRASLDAK